jgi:tetratricopeptide (TPR) repeat protein
MLLRATLLWLVCALHAAPPDDALREAQRAFQSGDLQRAATLAKQALALDANSEAAHTIVGLGAARSGQWPAAIESFEAVVRISPTSPHGNFFLGQAYHQQGTWKKAIPRLAKALELGHPERDLLLVQLAHALNESGEPEQALRTLRNVAAPGAGPLAMQYHATSAYAHWRLNQHGPALRDIRNVLALEDSEPEYWRFLIAALNATDQKNQALAEAIQAQKRFPDHPDVQFQFGLASYAVSQSPFTKLALRNLREAEGETERTDFLQGLVYRRLGQTLDANLSFSRAAEKGLQDSHVLLGILLKESGDYEGSEREFRAAEKDNPRNGQVHLELGKLLLAKGDLSGALSHLQQSAELLPADPGAHYQLGLVYARLGETEKAAHHSALFREFDKKLRALSGTAGASP